MDRYKLLLTNDDGPKSPFLLPFVEQLLKQPWVETLEVVVPAEEQSWIGQAISRFKPVYSCEHLFGGSPGYLVTGTPADCVGVALSSLCQSPPDLVLSGINLGTNAGIPFYLNSGTVGGARQAFCHGYRAIAVSSLIPGAIFSRCREEDEHVATEFAADFSRIAKNVCRLLGLIAAADSSTKLWQETDIFTINVPWELSETTPVVAAPLERVIYGTLFNELEKGQGSSPAADQERFVGSRSFRAYEHHFKGFAARDSERAGDVTALRNGAAVVTPVAYTPTEADFQRCAKIQTVLEGKDVRID